MANNAHPTTIPVQRVAGLTRIYFDLGINRYWVGAYNFGAGQQDRLFFLQVDVQGNPNGIAQLVNDVQNTITSSGADFYFLPFRTDPNAAASKFYGIVTNQLNQPLSIKFGKEFSLSNEDVFSAVLDATRNSGWQSGNLVNGVPDTTKFERITHVQSLAVYVGSVVYGGYHTIMPSTGVDTNFENYIVFSDPGQPYSIAENGGVMSSVRIGDTINEPVTAVAATTTTSDASGVKGQLVAFTNQKTVVFDGLPPQTGSPLGANFMSVASLNLGTNAPRSVVTTPHGVVFLGSDGVFYLIPAFTKMGPIPVGKKVWDLFRGLTPQQQRQVSAFWHPLGFYCVSYPSSQVYGGAASSLSVGVPLTTPANVVPNRTLTADFRQMNVQGTMDLGVRWFGPHVGQQHSCYAVAAGPSDRGQVYAGSAVDGSIIEVWREDLVTDPQPTNPSVLQQMQVYLATGVLDGGDAHQDKDIMAVSIGVGANQPATITTRLTTLGSYSGNQVGQSWLNQFTPPGTIPFTVGPAAIIAPADAINLLTNHPALRMIGRGWRAEFLEATANGAKLVFSDLGFRVRPVTRRP